MIKNSQQNNSSLRRIAKNSFSTERLNSRSKFDRRQYRIINSVKKFNEKSHKNYNNLNNNNLVKNLNINISYSSNLPDNNRKYLLKDKMPYIPNQERQKSESNFIKLINELIKVKKKKSSDKNMLNNNSNNIPYKPKGYNYYEYIRMNPFIISEDDENIYSKVVNKLQKEIENNKYNNTNNIQPNKSYKIVNKLSKNILKLNTSVTEENKPKLNPSILSKSYKYLRTLDNTNTNVLNDNDISNTDRLIHKTYDYNDNENKNNCILPSIINNKKDYRESDIFYLINNNLSKNKSSEKYLFKPNYMPPKIENEKKTNIINAGWLPKGHRNKSRIGCSSVAFNILSPGLKSISPTKKDIDVLNNNSFEKAPLMSEYIDICKPGDSMLRQDFSEKLNENKNIFHKKNYCAAYNDLHHEYKDIVNKVF